MAQKATHSPSGDDSQQQPGSTQAASSLSAAPATVAIGSSNAGVGNSVTSAPSDTQSSVTASDQLSRALVAQEPAVDQAGRTNFYLHLQPPHLGRVHIHLTATDHTVSARVIVAQEGTRQLIVNRAHQLRQSLAYSGLVLGSFDVMRDGSGSFASGHHPPPELPSPPTITRSKSATATPTAVVKTSPLVPTGGINVLA